MSEFTTERIAEASARLEAACQRADDLIVEIEVRLRRGLAQRERVKAAEQAGAVLAHAVVTVIPQAHVAPSILVVDDEGEIADMVGRTARELGYQRVTAAVSMRQAVLAIRAGLFGRAIVDFMLRCDCPATVSGACAIHRLGVTGEILVAFLAHLGVPVLLYSGYDVPPEARHGAQLLIKPGLGKLREWLAAPDPRKVDTEVM